MKIFAFHYFKIFDRYGERPRQEQLLKGNEYRYVIGLPGGMNSPYLTTFVDASKLQRYKRRHKFEFIEGVGNEDDNFGKK